MSKWKGTQEGGINILCELCVFFSFFLFISINNFAFFNYYQKCSLRNNGCVSPHVCCVFLTLVVNFVFNFCLIIFNAEYNTNSYNKNYNMANKFRQNLGDTVIVLTAKWHLGSDVSRVFLSRPVHTFNSRRCYHGWHLT